MRIAAVVFILLMFSFLWADVLLDASFDDAGPSVPAGWTVGGVNSGSNWYVSETNLAGGSANELRIDGGIASAGTIWIETEYVTVYSIESFTLSFRHKYSGTASDVEIKVFASDGVNPMVELYSNSDNTGVSIGSKLVKIPFTNPFLSDSQMKIVFQIGTSGSTIDFEYWAIDDFTLEGSVFRGVLTLEHSPYTISYHTNVPEGDTLRIEPGVELIFSDYGNICTYGQLEIQGTELQPVTATTNNSLRFHVFRVYGGLNAMYLHVHDITYQTSAYSAFSIVGIEMSSQPVSLYGCQFIDCDVKGSAVNSVGQELSCVNCTFTNVISTGTGGAIRTQSGSVVIDQCTFTGNEAYVGGAADLKGTAQVTDCTFTDNSCDYRSGALTFYNATATISDCTFENNSSANQGGAMCSLISTTTITNCTFTGNSATNQGGGIYYNENNLTMNGCHFTGNVASDGAAIYNELMYTASDHPLSIENSIFENNTAENNGGGIYNNCGITILTNSSFSGNISMSQGGTFFNSNCAVTITGCEFSRGSSVDGGAIYHDDNILSIANCVFDSCAATNNGGALYNLDATIDMTDCSFTGNTSATQGGSIYDSTSGVTISGCEFSYSSSADGGGIYHNQGQLTIDNSGFEHNTCGNRGACIYSNNGEVVITGCSYTENDATSYSGGIFADNGSVDLEQCDFTDNSSGNKGGAICTSNLAFTMDQCTLSNNSATNYGGALYCGNCVMSISDTPLEENVSINGGAMRISNSTIEYDNVQFTSNEATGSGGAMQLSNVSGSITKSLFTGNTGPIDLYIFTSSNIDLIQCTFVGLGSGVTSLVSLNSCSQLDVNSCIFWDIPDYSFHGLAADTQISVNYSDIENGQGNITTTGTLDWGTGNIESDPLFNNSSIGDYTLQYGSPCINAGDPALPLEYDGSVADMGAFSSEIFVPVLHTVVDAPGDQGHQLYLNWSNSSLDSGYSMTEFYSVWRLDTIPGRGALIIESPAELPAEPESSVVLLRDTEIWTFVQQVPAMNFETYSIVAPTMADSSSTGLNEVTFIVYYHDTLGLFASLEASGYSVDNIAPDTPRQLAAQLTDGSFHLSWEEVATGTLDGNSYPEQNGIWYIVYAGDSIDFTCDESTQIAVTRDPSAVVSVGSDERRFYKVVTADQQPVSSRIAEE